MRGNMLVGPADVLVNTVNLQGAMGAGLAKQFARYYPEIVGPYKHACRTNRIGIGRLHVLNVRHVLIINFPTKDDWRKPSRTEYITAGLDHLVEISQQHPFHTLALPPLGGGLGGLNHKEVLGEIMLRRDALRAERILLYNFDCFN